MHLYFHRAAKRCCMCVTTERVIFPVVDTASICAAILMSHLLFHIVENTGFAVLKSSNIVLSVRHHNANQQQYEHKLLYHYFLFSLK